MSNLLPLLLLFAAQDPAPPAAPDQGAGAPAGQDPIPVLVDPVGRGVQAPEQPSRASSSTWRRGPRHTPRAKGSRTARISTPISSLVKVRGQ